MLPTTVPELEKKKFELSGEANRLLILRKAQQDAQTELESKITKLAEDSARKAQLEVSAENARLTSLVESGSLSVEVANKRIKDFAKKVQTREENKLRKDAERISSDIQKDYQEIAKTEFAKIRTDTIRKVDKRDFIKIGVESAIIGAGLATLGPLGIPLGVGLLAFEVKRAGGIPEVIEVAKERPLSTTAGLVGGITGGLAVGVQDLAS